MNTVRRDIEPAVDDVVRRYQLQTNAHLKKPVDSAKFDELVPFLEAFWFGVAQLPSTME